MAQDIVADALNEIMNANRAGKEKITISWYSKLLLNILELAKQKGYIQDYDTEDNKLKVWLGKLNKCQAIKPRFPVNSENLEKYTRRYLPSRNFGILIITSSNGLITHDEAKEKNIGGSLIAYFY